MHVRVLLVYRYQIIEFMRIRACNNVCAVCMCMISAHACEFVYAVMGMCVHGNQRRGPRGLFCRSLPYSLRQGLSLKLELIWKAASPRDPSHNAAVSGSIAMAGFLCGFWDLNCVPCVCAASAPCHWAICSALVELQTLPAIFFSQLSRRASHCQFTW